MAVSLTTEPPASRKPRDWGVLLRSSAVGVAATLADLLMLVLLVDGLGWSKAAANVPALCLGLTVQFLGNKYYAFGDRSRDQLLRQGALFALVEAGAFILNAAAFHALAVVGGAHHLVSRVLGSGVVYFAYSYPLWGVIFRTPPARERTGESS
ncbi:MAG: GtrA family protein [Myxococcales bacterium]|nr:GtrA family protein [Myxococcales bacterium]